jgi:glycosyltransferase involved in cell wall biosynthesis
MNLRSRAGWPGDAAVVFSTRSFERVSDVPTLISAFAIARSRRPNLRLALAGDGSQRRALEDQAAAAGLGGAVRFLGQLADDEVFSCFCESDIYASCALCDGTSVSLLEAMSAGIMPLVTDIPSNREWITPPTNGWLASPGAPGVFAAAMIEAADVTPERRAGIRAQNRRQVAERADWNANRAKLDALYRAVCAENPSSPAL